MDKFQIIIFALGMGIVVVTALNGVKLACESFCSTFMKKNVVA